MANISFYGSHNSAVVVEDNGKIICVIEVERFLNRKNAGYGQYLVSHTRPFLLTEIVKWIEKTYGISEYENCYYLNSDTIEAHGKVFYHELIPAKNYVNSLHHLSHAACGFYQTDYDKALIISFDGGGNDGFFNIYVAENRETITEIERLNYDLGFPYMSFGDYLKDIKLEPALNIGNLVYSGKIMGLCSYGEVVPEWLEHFKEYYRAKPDGLNYIGLLNILGEKTGLVFNRYERLEGQTAWNVAKTSQIAFEEVFFELTKKHLDEYSNLPLIVVGGCGLNILLNTRLKKELNRDVFVPPNPNDCGIAAGMILYNLKPKTAVDLTYSGIPILDEDLLMSYCEDDWSVQPFDFETLLNDLSQDKIVGIVRGNSEHGPRALGNRSILIDPRVSDAKNKINSIKKRENYRPFGVSILKDYAEEYFMYEAEDHYMQYTCIPKKYFPEVTHVDNTCRVQFVDDKNLVFKQLLEEFYKLTGFPMLLNTSLNQAGKPLAGYPENAKDLFYENKNLDAVIIGNTVHLR